LFRRIQLRLFFQPIDGLSYWLSQISSLSGTFFSIPDQDFLFPRCLIRRTTFDPALASLANTLLAYCTFQENPQPPRMGDPGLHFFSPGSPQSPNPLTKTSVDWRQPSTSLVFEMAGEARRLSFHFLLLSLQVPSVDVAPVRGGDPLRFFPLLPSVAPSTFFCRG